VVEIEAGAAAGEQGIDEAGFACLQLLHFLLDGAAADQAVDEDAGRNERSLCRCTGSLE
jgi:hypothetical protein